MVTFRGSLLKAFWSLALGAVLHVIPTWLLESGVRLELCGAFDLPMNLH